MWVKSLVSGVFGRQLHCRFRASIRRRRRRSDLIWPGQKRRFGFHGEVRGSEAFCIWSGNFGAGYFVASSDGSGLDRLAGSGSWNQASSQTER